MPEALLVVVVVVVVLVISDDDAIPCVPLATNVEYNHIDPSVIKPSDTHLVIRECNLSMPNQAAPDIQKSNPNISKPNKPKWKTCESMSVLF